MIRAFNGIRYLQSSSMKQAVTELAVPVPWGQIRGKVWGPDNGRPVLCLHGWADNCGTFNTLIPLLPQECRYVAVDLAGHGLSSHRPPGEFYTFPSYVMDVRRVVDALQLKRFSIIGHSMGGNVAGMFSALYPDMVDAVVLLDSFGFFPTDLKEIADVVKQGFEEMLEFEKKEKDNRVYTYEKAVERLLAANPGLTESSVHVLLERGLVKKEGGVVFSRDFRINLKNIARISWEQSRDILSRIQASVLIILADDGLQKMYVKPDDRALLPDIVQAYRDKNNIVVTLPGGHHIHLNEPEVIAPLVTDFLQTRVLSQSDSTTHKNTSKL